MKRILFAFAIVFSPGVFGATVSSLAGDRDSFGTGLPDGSTVSVLQITAPGGEDGDFDQWSLALHGWTHTFDLAGETIVSAFLTLATLDVEDNGEGDGQGGGPFDTILLVDGNEVAGAFDDVFTPVATAQSQIVPNITVFDLTGFLDSLVDGTLDVLVNSFAGTNPDFISIDYAELRIVTRAVSVPEPATVWLSLLGIIGLALARSCRQRGRSTAPT